MLENLGAELEDGMRSMLRQKKALTFHRVGSMFCLFFSEHPVFDLESARRSDRVLFAEFFRRCLDAGVYFAPSQFETGFLSTAHTMADVERTIAIAAAALARHGGT